MTTPQKCYDAIKPVLDEIDRLIKTAPLDDSASTGLCLLISGHFYGLTAAYMNKNDIESGVREVCDLIVATIRPSKPKLKLVEGDVF